jgi:type IV pilus assembly protein PilY1
VDTRSELDNLLAWARGWSDSSKSETAAGLGDMLHSRPLVLNYGARLAYGHQRTSASWSAPTGFLHMFDNADGGKTGPSSRVGRGPRPAARQRHGRDPYTAWMRRRALQQDINATARSTPPRRQAVRLLRLRRGGTSITRWTYQPDSPAFLWKIDGTQRLRGTRTELVGARADARASYASDGVPKPVLVFGAGYDTAKDSRPRSPCPRIRGRGVYIVDAVTGALGVGVTGGQCEEPAG